MHTPPHPSQPQPYPYQPPPAGHRAPRQRPLGLLIVLIGLPALLLGSFLGAIVTFLLVAAPGGGPDAAGLAVAGTMTLNDGNGPQGDPCAGDGGYSDIREGAQVIVTDAGSKTLAVGRLGPGERNAAGDCVFAFEVAGVPGGHDFYGVEISHRGRLQYTAEQIGQPLELSLGD